MSDVAINQGKKQVVCGCGHDEKSHEHGTCRGEKLRQRVMDRESGEEVKTEYITELMPGPPCECPRFALAPAVEGPPVNAASPLG